MKITAINNLFMRVGRQNRHFVAVETGGQRSCLSRVGVICLFWCLSN